MVDVAFDLMTRKKKQGLIHVEEGQKRLVARESGKETGRTDAETVGEEYTGIECGGSINRMYDPEHS